MVLIVFFLIIGLQLHDAVQPLLVKAHVLPPELAWPLWAVLAALILPKLLVWGLYNLACRATAHALGTPRAWTAMRRLDRVRTASISLFIAMYTLDLWVGLDWLRSHIGNPVLINDLFVMSPTLALLAAYWWSYYPIDRRQRDATLISRLDAGLPIHAPWTRRQFIISQFRYQVGLFLVPLLLIQAWVEFLDLESMANVFKSENIKGALALTGVAVIFLLSPVIIRYIWDTVPLPEGELRDRLTDMCRQYRVGVRQLLLWRTFGNMINGAVMGLVSPVRFILLTDALLDMMPIKQVEAVMAHELAHVRRRHIFWLLVVAWGAMAPLVVFFLILMELLWNAAAHTHWLARLSYDTRVSLAENILPAVSMIAAVACWALVFTWVSRRFERQADTFAVQHLARERAQDAGQIGAVAIDPESAMTMSDALQAVADLNNIPINRRSWRHGSIAWRQAYLRSIIGRPANTLHIDRLVIAIKIAALLAAAFGALVIFFPLKHFA